MQLKDTEELLAVVYEHVIPIQCYRFVALWPKLHVHALTRLDPIWSDNFEYYLADRVNIWKLFRRIVKHNRSNAKGLKLSLCYQDIHICWTKSTLYEEELIKCYEIHNCIVFVLYMYWL